MALSMDEQRILAEIEEHLAQAEPGLAARFSALGRTRPGRGPQSARTHFMAALATAILVAAVSLVVYTLVSWRGGQSAGVGGRSTASPQARVTAPQISSQRSTPTARSSP